MHVGARKAVRIALGAVGAVVAVLVLAQLLLPGIAARRVRDELARYGVVHSVSISAFPAIELLWGDAHSASMSAGSVTMSPAQANQLLARAQGVQRIDMHASSMHVGTLTLHNFTWTKRNRQIRIGGVLSEAQLREALPGSTGFELLSSRSGTATMRVSGSLFGVSAALDVQLEALEGKLVAQPQGVPFGGLVKVTLLSAPHLDVQSIALADTPGAAGADPSYRLSIAAQLR